MKQKRPYKTRIDWSAVDWSKRNPELAKELDCHLSSVVNHRAAAGVASPSRSKWAGRGGWTQIPPTEQGEYWHWNGDTDCAACALSVMYSGTNDKCFVCINDDDHARWVGDHAWSGWWLRIPEPKLPVAY